MALQGTQPQTVSFPEAGFSAAQLRRLQVQAARLVTGNFAGAYRSVFRGRGVEFEGVREYQPGDDVRNIDWNVTARIGRPFLKQFVEERDLTVMLLLDRSPSLDCPTPRGPKRRVAAEACALLAFATALNNDRIGLLTCSDRIEQFLPPGKGSRHARQLVGTALSSTSTGRGTDLAGSLEYLSRASRSGSTLCLVSDFHCAGLGVALAAAARRHHVVALLVTDQSDLELPDAGVVRVRDPESGAMRIWDSSSESVRRAYREQAAARRSELLRSFAAAGVRHLELDTAHSAIDRLARFFNPALRYGRG